LDLPPGVYHFPQVVVGGGSLIQISGPTVMYVTGKYDSGGGSFVNDSSLPSNFRLFVNGDVCRVGGDGDQFGIVYAPNAKIDISGGSDFYGSVFGREVRVGGGGWIHADESLGILEGTDSPVSLVE